MTKKRHGARSRVALNRATAEKHARFVSEYLLDLNGAAAAVRAGYHKKLAPALLARPSIAAAIAAGKARQLDTAELSAVRVLEELRRMAFVDVAGMYDDQGQPKALRLLSCEQRAALQSVDVVVKNVAAGDGVTDTVYKIKVHDKTRSLEMLAKHFELLVERVKVDSTSADARVARLVAARSRVKG